MFIKMSQLKINSWKKLMHIEQKKPDTTVNIFYYAIDVKGKKRLKLTIKSSAVKLES